MADRWSLDAARHLLRHQEGVVARHQLLELGANRHDVERLVRRRELTTAHPGVYVTHTGRLTPAQREWAAVMACWPAALSHRSALPAELRDRPGDLRPVEISVDLARRPRPPSGVQVHRVADLDARVAWNRSPPRVRLEHAAIDVASGLLARDRVADAFDLLARTCHTRLTTPSRMAGVLARRSRVHGRSLLTELLSDLADGSCSVLERGWVHEVERPHGLPPARRQRRRRVDGRTTYVDADYDPYDVLVELDGLAFHGSPAQRDRDAMRDLANLVAGGSLTARVTYGMVFDTPCDTAAQVASLLRRGGWTGSLRRCGRCRDVA